MAASYQELIRLTELYLLNEHQLSDRIYSDPNTIAFFRDQVKPKKPKHEPLTQSNATMPKPEHPSPKPNTSPTTISAYSDLTEMGNLINQLYPQLQTHSSIPAYVPNLQAVILIDLSDEQHRTMLLNITNAIESKLQLRAALSSTLEIQWEKLLSNTELRLIIVSRETLKKHEQLTDKGQLIIIESLDELSAQPELKKQLWNQIKDKITR